MMTRPDNKTLMAFAALVAVNVSVWVYQANRHFVAAGVFVECGKQRFTAYDARMHDGGLEVTQEPHGRHIYFTGLPCRVDDLSAEEIAAMNAPPPTSPTPQPEPAPEMSIGAP